MSGTFSDRLEYLELYYSQLEAFQPCYAAPSLTRNWCSWYWVSLQAYISTLLNGTSALATRSGSSLAREQIPEKLMCFSFDLEVVMEERRENIWGCVILFILRLREVKLIIASEKSWGLMSAKPRL